MTRRTAIMMTSGPLFLAGPAYAQLSGDVTTSDLTDRIHAQKEIPTNDQDTFLIVIPVSPSGFEIGVRTKVKADLARITVFYRSGSLLLSEESIAPVVGFNGYGGTNRPFSIANEAIAFIRISFLRTVSERTTETK